MVEFTLNKYICYIDQFEWFMDKPSEFCKHQYRSRVGKAKEQLNLDLWENTETEIKQQLIQSPDR